MIGNGSTPGLALVTQALKSERSSSAVCPLGAENLHGNDNQIAGRILRPGSVRFASAGFDASR
ncbi:hypothetical protein ROS1_17670 [Roseibium sp. ROS1]